VSEVALLVERDKLVKSFARWLANLPPEYSSKRYYFEKYRNAAKVVEKLKQFRGTLICPFCGRKFNKVSGYVTHIISAHLHDIEELFRGGQ